MKACRLRDHRSYQESKARVLLSPSEICSMPPPGKSTGKTSGGRSGRKPSLAIAAGRGAMHALAPPLRRTSGGDGAFAPGIEIDGDAIYVNSPEKTAAHGHEMIPPAWIYHQPNSVCVARDCNGVGSTGIPGAFDGNTLHPALFYPDSGGFSLDAACGVQVCTRAAGRLHGSRR